MRSIWPFVVLLAGLVQADAASAEPLDHFATTDDIGVNKVPHLGESHVLVIPHRTGETTFPAARLAELQKVFAPEGGPGTFRDFWRVTSNGRYDPIPTLVLPVLYPTTCPLPDHTIDNCKVSLMDIDLIGSAGLRFALQDILARVRDEQQIDLAQFDVNSAAGAGSDGYFDGLILDTDIYSGIGFPLAVLNNDTASESTPGGGGPIIRAGVVALIPPARHEFGHNLGFVDLYNGPAVNCLMADTNNTLSAFSRQQIGWGAVLPIAHTTTITLAPVLDGGSILKVGSGQQYLLIENRGGPQHVGWESNPAGINVYAIDETKLPRGTFGFLDVANRNLYYPNKEAPYLNVNLPVGCALSAATEANGCILQQSMATRHYEHPSTGGDGFSLTVGTIAADGSITVTIDNGIAPPSEGCAATPSWANASSLVGIAVAVYLLRRRSRCQRQTSTSGVAGSNPT